MRVHLATIPPESAGSGPGPLAPVPGAGPGTADRERGQHDSNRER